MARSLQHQREVGGCLFTQVWGVAVWEGPVPAGMNPPAEVAAEAAGGTQPAASEGGECGRVHTSIYKRTMNVFSHKCEAGGLKPNAGLPMIMWAVSHTLSIPLPPVTSPPLCPATSHAVWLLYQWRGCNCRR